MATSEDDVPPDPPETQAGPVAPPAARDEAPVIALMITRRQRQALRDLGRDDDAIGIMTPEEAHRILRLADLL